jgi:hypothetical protein
MDFDALYHSAARQQLTLLGGVVGSVIKSAVTIDPALVLIERGVQVPSDNGITLESRVIASLLVGEVGSVVKGNKIVTPAETFNVQDVMEDDGYVIKVFVRG